MATACLPLEGVSINSDGPTWELNKAVDEVPMLVRVEAVAVVVVVVVVTVDAVAAVNVVVTVVGAPALVAEAPSLVAFS